MLQVLMGKTESQIVNIDKMDKIVPPLLITQFFNRFKTEKTEECDALSLMIPLVMVSHIVYDSKLKLIFSLCCRNVPELKPIKDNFVKRDWNEDHLPS